METNWNKKVVERALEHGDKMPSERIYQIFSALRQKKGGNKNSDKIEAVIRYLDEQAALQKPHLLE